MAPRKGFEIKEDAELTVITKPSGLTHLVSRLYNEVVSNSTRTGSKAPSETIKGYADPALVRGRLVVLQPNGFGLVRLDNNEEAFFRGSDLSASRARVKGKVKAGCRVVGKIAREERAGNSIHLVEVARD